MTIKLHLLGCTPTPLAHYLKALGVLRLVAEQAEPGARGGWQAEHFVLQSELTQDGLVDFLLRSYRPTPMVAPWNGGSGFFPKDNKKGIEVLATARAPRFGDLQVAIDVCRNLLAKLRLDQSPKEEIKQTLILELRAVAPEPLLAWLDAALLLSTDHLRFPPLLGTGGNDGRLDFTNNFMQRLVELFDPEDGAPQPGASDWLRAALFAASASGLARAAIGQFAPGAAGGPNATAGFEAESLVNPWDFVLMLEGAMLFAAAATRRLGTRGEPALSYPFTVQPTGGGSGAVALSDERQARAEIWLPLWCRPSSCPEIRALLAEGRATLGRRPARDGLDFARSVARLGIDRGVRAFQRYAFQQRAGRAYIATPLGRIVVRRNPMADLIDQVDRADWLGRFRRFARRDAAPARLSALGRRLDDTLFALAAYGAAERVQGILTVLGEIMTYVAHSPASREALRPLPPLDPNWIEAAEDGSSEFRIAAALAGLRADGDDLPMRLHFAPVDDKGSGWTDLAPQFVWGAGSLVDNLVAILRRRLMEAGRRQLQDKPLASTVRAELADVMTFLAATTDDARIAGLLAGLVHVRAFVRFAPRRLDPPNVPLPYAVLKPLFGARSVLVELGALGPDAAFPIPAGLLGRLLDRSKAGIKDATEMAARRGRASGMSPAIQPGSAPGIDGRRLAAALLIPIGTRAMRQILERAYPNALASTLAHAAAEGE